MKNYYYPEKNYYYLAIVLPKLSIDEKPEMPFYEFAELLKENLTPTDYDKTRRMRWLFDLRNVVLDKGSVVVIGKPSPG